jgi:glycosyltransferase involved in cell wall biosynthesis
MIEPIMAFLAKKGLSSTVIRYGAYQHKDYANALARSKSMIFLCEHETQGMAYQEALTSNVPVIAWENGFWLDPRRAEYDPNPVPATSVPYFSDQCGEKFRDFAQFPDAFEGFWVKLDSYEPRAYVREHLSFADSAKLYLESYRAAAG